MDKTLYGKFELLLTDAQREGIKRLAKERGLSASALIRRIIDALLSLTDGQRLSVCDKDGQRVAVILGL